MPKIVKSGIVYSSGSTVPAANIPYTPPSGSSSSATTAKAALDELITKTETLESYAGQLTCFRPKINIVTNDYVDAASAGQILYHKFGSIVFVERHDMEALQDLNDSNTYNSGKGIIFATMPIEYGDHWAQFTGYNGESTLFSCIDVVSGGVIATETDSQVTLSATGVTPVRFEIICSKNTDGTTCSLGLYVSDGTIPRGSFFCAHGWYVTDFYQLPSGGGSFPA